MVLMMPYPKIGQRIVGNCVAENVFLNVYILTCRFNSTVNMINHSRISVRVVQSEIDGIILVLKIEIK